ncbi:hypothetical protein [Photobacterium kishitanii]|uniref:Uncharacterized protein n=1 Tax=Photobacterium kishitanii TaxID=318456 RepID=A0A2T3KMW0_9GAMM|nr:hypothetical protein [Photobacterium kishitanii]PSV01085.1 hypothetical protein C9J27_03440 [Photobacterium kishitanii]
MKNLKNKLITSLFSAAIMMSSSSVFAAGTIKDAKTFNTQIIGQIMSFGGVMAVLAFMLGAWAVFKCITTFLNHADDPRQNPLKNCAYYFVAAGLGFGYSLSSSLFSGTLWGDTESTMSGQSENVFKVEGVK